MRTLIPKTQVMNIHIIGSGGGGESSLIGCMQMSSYWGSGTAVGKIISPLGSASYKEERKDSIITITVYKRTCIFLFLICRKFFENGNVH